ncbi:MAG: glycosyltransferase [Acidimicrobiales bacterium]|nr:glycosyltransferase [Acidimicrobiales bacterium]
MTYAVSPTAHLVVVHRNRGDTCRQTVERFREQAELTVTVVDNGSRADELAALEFDLDDDVEVVRTGHNLGFGPGANVGLDRWLAGPHEFCLLAPHDARPLEGTVLRLLEELDSRPSAGLACADVGDGEVPRIQPYLGPIGGPASGTDGWEEADYPHGTLMALRRACIVDVGTFDERYFAYCEEADLGIRARRAGWEVGLVRGALVDNPESGSEAALIDYLMVRNTLLLLATHFGWYNAVFRAAVVVLESTVGWWRPEVRSPYHTGSSRFRALRHAALGRFGPP